MKHRHYLQRTHTAPVREGRATLIIYSARTIKESLEQTINEVMPTNSRNNISESLEDEDTFYKIISSCPDLNDLEVSQRLIRVMEILMERHDQDYDLIKEIEITYRPLKRKSHFLRLKC